MEKASGELEFETARCIATGLAALRRSSRSRASIPAPWKRADVFAIHQEAAIPASRCSSSAPAELGATVRTFHASEKSFTAEEVLSSFLAQFYDDKPPPKLILLVARDRVSGAVADAPVGQGRSPRSRSRLPGAAKRRSWSRTL